MSKEKIEKIFNEDFAKICDDKDKRSGERLWYLRVDDAEKMLKKLIFNKILPEVFKELIDNKSLIDKSNGRYNRECELRKKIKKLYNIEL